MFSHNRHSLIRNILLVDAATCSAMGAALTVATRLLATLTALPPALLFYAGALLFPIAAFMALVATRASISVGAVWLVILGNLFWVAASLCLLVGGWVSPNALGYAFVIVQALAVAVIAVLEHMALRRTAAPLAA